MGKGLNDNLAKQAALADSRFEKTVKDISAARKAAATAVSDMRKDFGVRMVVATATVKNIQQNLVDEIAKVSGEVISLKANQVRVNRRVTAELKRTEKLANDRFSDSKRARGKLRQLMDENKQAAAAEVKTLATELTAKVAKARAKNAHNKIAFAKDLTAYTETFYEKFAAQQKTDRANSEALDASTIAASVGSANALKAARKSFDSSVVMLTNVVIANEKSASDGMARITGVVHNYAKAAAADRNLVKGEAKAKSVEQRVAEHLKKTKRFLQVELNESVERAADNVYKLLEGNRQKIADTYLSLNAYAAAAADSVDDAVSKGR